MVYPRTGGGNSAPRRSRLKSQGLSPHGRGKPGRRGSPADRRRSIPARAGETLPPLQYPGLLRVYPRTGGGNGRRNGIRTRPCGLSPHGRGKRNDGRGRRGYLRSIPARAGETLHKQLVDRLQEVYPRTGGGNFVLAGIVGAGIGLSPHGRGKRRLLASCWLVLRSIPARAGETIWRGSTVAYTTVYPRTGGGNGLRLNYRLRLDGLSPHGRGKPARATSRCGRGGSIPARAGETHSHPHSTRGKGVYPRTGGGNRHRQPGIPKLRGLSPHGRGKLIPQPANHPDLGSIPARAGETPTPWEEGGMR